MLSRSLQSSLVAGAWLNAFMLWCGSSLSVPRHCYVEHGVNIQIDRRPKPHGTEHAKRPPSYHFNDCVMEWMDRTDGPELREPSRNVWQPGEHWNSCTGLGMTPRRHGGANLHNWVVICWIDKNTVFCLSSCRNDKEICIPNLEDTSPALCMKIWRRFESASSATNSKDKHATHVFRAECLPNHEGSS